jgi:hypothetical protein
VRKLPYPFPGGHGKNQDHHHTGNALAAADDAASYRDHI